MNDGRPAIESFIIKLRFEHGAAEKNAVGWRGFMIHVPSGDRHAVCSLTDIVVVLIEYLERAGARLSIFWRVFRAIGRRSSPLRRPQ